MQGPGQSYRSRPHSREQELSLNERTDAPPLATHLARRARLHGLLRPHGPPAPLLSVRRTSANGGELSVGLSFGASYVDSLALPHHSHARPAARQPPPPRPPHERPCARPPRPLETRRLHTDKNRRGVRSLHSASARQLAETLDRRLQSVGIDGRRAGFRSRRAVGQLPAASWCSAPTRGGAGVKGLHPRRNARWALGLLSSSDRETEVRSLMAYTRATAVRMLRQDHVPS